MTDQEENTKTAEEIEAENEKEEQAKQEKEVSQGLIQSPYDDFPGYIQFPYPLQLHHVSKWWSMAVDANKKLEKTDHQFHVNQWQSYRYLLTEFDGWHIEKVPLGDVKSDRVPSILMSFVMYLGEQYILNQLSPKQVAVLRTVL